jgi:hypothetical protein
MRAGGGTTTSDCRACTNHRVCTQYCVRAKRRALSERSSRARVE